MSLYYRAITSIVCPRPPFPALEIDVAYGPLTMEEKRAENLVRACSVMEPNHLHRKQEVVFDDEPQPRG